jgi:hypothetical protein
LEADLKTVKELLQGYKSMFGGSAEAARHHRRRAMTCLWWQLVLAGSGAYLSRVSVDRVNERVSFGFGDEMEAWLVLGYVCNVLGMVALLFGLKALYHGLMYQPKREFGRGTDELAEVLSRLAHEVADLGDEHTRIQAQVAEAQALASVTPEAAQLLNRSGWRMGWFFLLMSIPIAVATALIFS